jgi:hypothetical protein
MFDYRCKRRKQGQKMQGRLYEKENNTCTSTPLQKIIDVVLE